jgi:hypothetical protein
MNTIAALAGFAIISLVVFVWLFFRMAAKNEAIPLSNIGEIP